MKTHRLLFIILTGLLISCNNSEPELGALHSEQDRMLLHVIKFTNTKYKNMILAYDKNAFLPNKEYNFFYTCKEQNENIEEWAKLCKIFSKSPFIDIGNGYLLIDWKWGAILSPIRFQRFIDIHNIQYTILLEHNWSELFSISQEWNINEPNDHNSIEKVYHFQIKAIDMYRGDSTYIDKNKGWDKHIFYPTADIWEGRPTTNMTEEEIHRIDSLQSIYADILSNVMLRYKFDNDYINNIE